MANTLWTLGHSTRPFEEFVELLQTHGIRSVVDVRRFPSSRRNPQFNSDALTRGLPSSGLRYAHLPGLGGRRPSSPDSPNLGWRNLSFRGYADYMLTPTFQQAMEELVRIAEAQPTAIMCAEAVPWRCHRSLIADAFLVRGWAAFDIVSPDHVSPHTLPSWAKFENGRLAYPGPVGSTGELF